MGGRGPSFFSFFSFSLIHPILLPFHPLFIVPPSPPSSSSLSFSLPFPPSPSPYTPLNHVCCRGHCPLQIQDWQDSRPGHLCCRQGCVSLSPCRTFSRAHATCRPCHTGQMHALRLGFLAAGLQSHPRCSFCLTDCLGCLRVPGCGYCLRGLVTALYLSMWRTNALCLFFSRLHGTTEAVHVSLLVTDPLWGCFSSATNLFHVPVRSLFSHSVLVL